MGQKSNSLDELELNKEIPAEQDEEMNITS